jgi:hypothetical protein
MDIVVSGDATRGLPSRPQQIISEGSTTTYDKFGNMQHVSVLEKIDSARNGLKEMAFSVTDKAAAEKYLKRFDDSVKLAMDTEVANFVLVSPIPNLNQLRSGKIDDTKMQDLWNNMSASQRASAKSAAYSALTEENTREAQLEAQQARDMEKRSKVAYTNIVDAIQSGDTKARDAALSELRITDPGKYEDFSKRILSGDVPDNAMVVGMLEQELANKTLRKSFVTTEFINGNISLSTFKTYMGSVTALSDKRYQAAGTLAKNILGLPDKPLINPGSKDRKAQQKVAAIMVELQAKQFDPNTPEDFDPLAFVDKRANEIKVAMDNDNSAAIAKAEKRMPKIAKAFGLPENSSYEDIAAAFAKSTNDRIKNVYQKDMDTLTGANK